MLNNILQIGSVIRGEGYMGCIVGLKLITVRNKKELAYEIVPYPLGFTEPKCLRMIRHNDEYEIVCKGMESEAHNIVAKYYDGLLKIADMTTADEFDMYIQQAYEKMKNQGDIKDEGTVADWQCD